jgi:mono/diheme cytochrome c family protein
MEAGAFFLLWIFLALAVVVFAIARTSKQTGEYEARPPATRFTRIALLVIAAGVFVVLPIAVVSAADDRVPSGSGEYIQASAADEREGRMLFRETCASCHTLEAAQARGIYGPNLDTLSGLTTERVEAAIATGVGSGTKMPAGLLKGEQAKLVSEYVAEVAGSGRN